MEDLREYLPADNDADLSDDARRAKESLAEFIRQSWHVTEQTTPLEWNWHIDAVADHVQASLQDWMAVQGWRQRSEQDDFDAATDPEPVQRFQNLLINIPPGTAKSRIVSVCAPAWMWLRWASWRSIFVSANPRVANRDSVYCRELIESDWYQETFRPNWRLTYDQNAKTLYRNTAGGSRAAFGFNSKITGDRADALFVDDPNDADEVHSDTIREGVNDRWDSAIGNRVNDLRCSVRIGIMQRLHEADWSGHILAKGGWEHLRIPQEFEPASETQCKCPSCLRGETSIGWRDPRTKAGELLFPLRFPPSVLDAERTRLGSDGYEGQHQQNPRSAEGLIFKRSWFTRRYRSLSGITEVFSTWDTALKDKEQNDESAFVVWGLHENGDILLLRAARGHWDTPDLEKLLVDQATYLRQVFGARYKGDYVEDKVSGTTLMRYVRRSHPELALIPIPVEIDKVARAKGVSPMCEAERVVLPDPEIFPDTIVWCEDLVSQVTGFPKGRFKDLTDAFVHGLMRLMGTIGKRKSRRGTSGGQI